MLFQFSLQYIRITKAQQRKALYPNKNSDSWQELWRRDFHLGAEGLSHTLDTEAPTCPFSFRLAAVLLIQVKLIRLPRQSALGSIAPVTAEQG